MDDFEYDIYRQAPVISGAIDAKTDISEDELKKYQGCRVLVTDSNKIDNSILSSIFQRMEIDYTIQTSENSAITEIVEFGNYYDIVLIDQYIEENLVVNLVSSIRYDKRFDTMPIVIMIPLGEEKHTNLSKYGINAILKKPLMASHIYTLFDIFVGDLHKHILNINRGMEHTNGDLELYHTILREFLNNYSQADRDIIKFIYREEYDRLGQFIVDIEGLSGTIGADIFHTVTAELLKKYRENNYQDISFLLPRFRNELYKVLNRIKKNLDK